MQMVYLPAIHFNPTFFTIITPHCLPAQESSASQRRTNKFNGRVHSKMKAENTPKRAKGINGKGLLLNLMLTVFKLGAGFFGNSTVLLADAVRSFQDFTAESTKLLDRRIALKPEDMSHNYGHGKIATIFMGAWAVMLLLAGFQVLSQGTGELITFIKGQDPLSPGISAFFAAALSPLSKGILLRYEKEEKMPTEKRKHGNRYLVPGVRCCKWKVKE